MGIERPPAVSFLKRRDAEEERERERERESTFSLALSAPPFLSVSKKIY